MNIQVFLPLLGYMLLIGAISVYVIKKRSTAPFLNDYFLGNRSMGAFLLAMTLSTTYVSASSFIGGPGSAWKYGLGWVLVAMLQVPTVWLSLSVLGKKFAILARRYQCITLNDVLYARYGSTLLVWIASLSLLVAFFAAMTVQFIGGARLLENTIDVPYQTGLWLFGGTVAFYTAFGGFRASVLNDALHGLVMLIGTFILLFAVIHTSGGLPVAIEKLRRIDPLLVSPEGGDHIVTPAFLVSFCVLVCFGVLGLPHTAVRCIAYKDSKAVHRGMILGTVIMTILVLGMHLTGALGRAILPNLTVPDSVIPTLIMTVLPPLAAGLFIAAPIAAIMSTINAQLLQSSSTLINDLYLRLFPQHIKKEILLRRLSQTVTLLLSILLLVAAQDPPDMIIWLNLLAFGGLEVVFLWPLILGLYWEKANAAGALSAMIVGAVTYVLLLVLKPSLGGFHPVVPALLLSLMAFMIGNHIRTRWQ